MIKLIIGLIIGLGIAGILMIIENLLCTKFRNPLFGGIIPVLILVFSIGIFISNIVPLKDNNLFPFVILNLAFLGDWITGRENYKKRQQAEIDKMKARDI